MRKLVHTHDCTSVQVKEKGEWKRDSARRFIDKSLGK